MSDKVIEQIRESRRRMSEECGHDPARLVELIRRMQPRYSKQIRKYERTHDVSRAPLARSA